MIPNLDRVSYFSSSLNLEPVVPVQPRAGRVDRVDPIQPGPYEEAASVSVQISPAALEKSRSFTDGGDSFSRDSDGSGKTAYKQAQTGETAAVTQAAQADTVVAPDKSSSQSALRKAFSAGLTKDAPGTRLEVWA